MSRPIPVVAAVTALALAAAVVPPGVGAQARSADLAPVVVIGQVSAPGVGNAVVLASNSVYIERGADVLSGDVVVNEAVSGPTLSIAALTVESNATTPAGYALKGDTVSVARFAVVGGDVFYNSLDNKGTINGTLTTPLVLPVFTQLPPLEQPFPRPDPEDVIVPAGGFADVPADTYGILDVGSEATVRLDGGRYTFSSINVGTDGAMVFGGPAVVVVTGRVRIGQGAVVGAEAGAPADASDVAFHVHGINGADGGLFSLPFAFDVGKNGTLSANVYAPFGSVVLDREVVAEGAFIGHDVHVKKDSTVALDSAFGNQAPTADPQAVVTSGATPVEILLTGSDPEGEDLTFSIVSGPSFGTLSAITHVVPDPVPNPEPPPATVQPPITSATVTYTPDTADDVEDFFTFQVADPAGATGSAMVSINQRDDPRASLTVSDLSDIVTQETAPETLGLVGFAPQGVTLTFSILSGPANGTLSDLTQVPPTEATVEYDPDDGFLGTDSFDFQACGVIGGVTECDSATFTIEVISSPTEPVDLAIDRQATTGSEAPVTISLSGETSAASELQALSTRRTLLSPKAAFIDGAAVAGNVADANDDGLGDNHNDLPGSVPVFMSAAVDQQGGAGSQGTSRMQIEWDISSFGNLAGELVSADVILETHRGTVDELDTFFFWQAEDNDGLLTDPDFQRTAEQIPGVVMPVPPLETMPVGSDGTFSFSVLGQIVSALEAGFDVFSVQGRVDETLTGPARGLEVRTSASGNLSSFLEPKLSLTTPGVVPPTEYRILSLPENGTLRDSSQNLITTTPYLLPDSRVTYTSNVEFIGTDTFQYEVEFGQFVDSASVFVQVVLGSCVDSEAFCDDGR